MVKEGGIQGQKGRDSGSKGEGFRVVEGRDSGLKGKSEFRFSLRYSLISWGSFGGILDVGLGARPEKDSGCGQ